MMLGLTRPIRWTLVIVVLVMLEAGCAVWYCSERCLSRNARRVGERQRRKRGGRSVSSRFAAGGYSKSRFVVRHGFYRPLQRARTGAWFVSTDGGEARLLRGGQPDGRGRQSTGNGGQASSHTGSA